MSQTPTPTRIMLIEDEGPARELAEKGLRIFFPEAEILAFELGDHALDFLEQEGKTSTPIDICITDQSMPGTSGVDLLSALTKKLSAQTPILITSGMDGGEYLKGINTDVWDVDPARFSELSKPYKLSDLKEQVLTVFNTPIVVETSAIDAQPSAEEPTIEELAAMSDNKAPFEGVIKTTKSQRTIHQPTSEAGQTMQKALLYSNPKLFEEALDMIERDFPRASSRAVQSTATESTPPTEAKPREKVPATDAHTRSMEPA